MERVFEEFRARGILRTAAMFVENLRLSRPVEEDGWVPEAMACLRKMAQECQPKILT